MISIVLSVVGFSQIVRLKSIMTSITDPNMSDRFTNAMEEIHNKQLKVNGEIIDTTVELCQSHRQFVKSALGMVIVINIMYPYSSLTNHVFELNLLQITS